MSQSGRLKASEKVQMNCEMAAHLQSVRSFATMGEGGGGGTSWETGATASGTAALLGIAKGVVWLNAGATDE
jgi:hypothetical protein